MKICLSSAVGKRAFTFTETMVVMALGLVVIGGVLTGHLVGARFFQVTSTKLGGNDDARIAIAKLTHDIRMAKVVRIGNGNSTTFVPCGASQAQSGNAIQVYPTMATNNWIRYFKHTDNRLHRMTNSASSVLVLANFITNNAVFTSENFNGQVLTNNENNRVIGLTMQFYQIQYPIIKIGTNELYDFYQVRTKVTRRTLE